MTIRIRRRKFLATLGGAAAWPLAARAQQAVSARRIGALMPYDESDPEAQIRVATFRQALHRLGWSDGRNIQIELRFTTPDAATTHRLTNELVDLHPDLILTDSTPPTAAMLQQTRSIPVVFVQVGDPVGSGFVSSIPRPGGNATGFTIFAPSISGKWLELIRDIAPSTARVAFLFNPATAPYASIFLDTFKSAAASLKVEGIATPVHDSSGMKSAIAALEGGGLIVLPSFFMTAHRDLIIAEAARHRVPAIYPFRHFAISGGLMSYGNLPADAYRQAAFYVDRILRGAQPADLPVQAPTKFELVINLRTAATLGLTVPLIMQMTADEVIE
jgi:putative tryptophan/tyrosine transport system substrate-binding protein